MMGPDLGRIEKAKEERRKQLLKWDEYDRTYQNSFNPRSRKNGSALVRFEPNLVFLEAASRGDLVEVKKLIKSGINTNVANEDGLTALHQCCIDNNLEMCTLLLENGANVNAKDNEQWTPLHAAATCGNKELCGLLITWGADLLALNIDGNMPYDLCDDDDTLILVETEMARRHVTQKQIDEIRLRPEKEMLSDLKRRYAADDNLQSLDVQGAAPIHIAAACGYAEVARYLLQLNVDPQQPDQDGWLPIHIAVSWGHLEIIEILVAYGADMDAPMRNGQTVHDVCDSKELQMRLREIWDRRDELRSTVRKASMTNNNAPTNFARGFGSSGRRSSSIMRTSMRDKHRLTRTDAEKERQLREQLVNEASKENGSVERVQPNLQNNAAALSDPVNSTATLAAVAAVSKSRKQPTRSSELRSTPEVNGVGSPATKRGNNSTTMAPEVPSRTTRPVRSGDSGPSPSQSLSPTTSKSHLTTLATTNTETSSSSSTVTLNASPDNSSSAETQSESSDSQANYVRPMQRNSNGKMVPISSDSTRSPQSQRSRPTPPSRDNRSRAPRRPDTSLSATSSKVSAVGDEGRRNSTPSPNIVPRRGPLPAKNDIPSSKIGNVTPSSSFVSTSTLNLGYGGESHRPFLCCHTM